MRKDNMGITLVLESGLLPSTSAFAGPAAPRSNPPAISLLMISRRLMVMRLFSTISSL